MPITRVTWRKSSYSGQSGSCVEVGVAPTGVGVRDTKNPRHTLTFRRGAWNSFVAAVQAHRFGA